MELSQWKIFNKRIYKWSIVISIFIAGIVCTFSDIDAKHTVSNKNRKNIMNLLYPMLYGNTLKNSLVPVSVLAKGQITWRKLFVEQNIGSLPCLLVADSQIFIVFSQKIISYNADGEKLWEKPKWGDSPAILWGNRIYFEEGEYGGRHLVSVSNDGEINVIKENIACEKEKVVYLEPEINSYIGCVLMTQRQKPDESGKLKTIPPYYAIFSKQYAAKWGSVWISEGFENMVVSPLHLKKQNQLVIFLEGHFKTYNSATKNKNAELLQQATYQFEKIINASADNTGTLYLLGEKKKQIWLIACDIHGKPLWKWTHEGLSSFSPTPPACTPKKEVIIFGNNSIYGVVEGKTEWELKTGLNKPSYITTDSEGVILLAAESKLFCAKRDNVHFEVEIDSDIIAPPVVDQKGHVYLLTRTEIVKIN
ncbi:MAG: hypothetical protein JW768_08260 [Chitinispirillaceae bacterium]|nr:hypothetical protein [Chitinispirillaceae bacterium]